VGGEEYVEIFGFVTHIYGNGSRCFGSIAVALPSYHADCNKPASILWDNGFSMLNMDVSNASPNGIKRRAGVVAVRR
jgi:hypothetical protein